jgi:hypothetical protein
VIAVKIKVDIYVSPDLEKQSMLLQDVERRSATLVKAEAEEVAEFTVRVAHEITLLAAE